MLRNAHEGDHIVSIKNISDLMFAYGAVANQSVNDKRQFIYDLENTSIEKLTMKDKFNTVDSTKLLWGLAKFTNRNLNPQFNDDPASCLLNRYSLAQVRSVSHRLPVLVAENVIGQKKKQSFQNMALSLYAMASLDFYHKDYFESVFSSHFGTDIIPTITELAMIAQAVAILRRSEFTPTLVDWLVKGIYHYDLMTTGWNLSYDKDFVSALTAVIQLVGDEEPLMEMLRTGLSEELPRVLHHIEVEMGPDHVQLIPSLLWCVMCLGDLSSHQSLVQKGLNEVQTYMKQHGSISFPSSILLNQVLNHLQLAELHSKQPLIDFDPSLLETI